MPVTYAPAPAEVYSLMNRVIDERFPELAKAGVKVEILMASNGDKPAVKLHGAACAAKIAVVKPVERATGGPDERILIDAKLYGNMRPRRREALLAHELNHVVVPRDEDGDVVTDDYDRPATKHRPDDWILSGFGQIADWYGEDSIEHQGYSMLQDRLGQGLMPFMGDEADAGSDPGPTGDELADEGEGDGRQIAGRLARRA